MILFIPLILEISRAAINLLKSLSEHVPFCEVKGTFRKVENNCVLLFSLPGGQQF